MKTKKQNVLIVMAFLIIQTVITSQAQDNSPSPAFNPLQTNPQTTYEPGLHLLVDPDSIVESEGVKIFVNQAQRHPEPILVSTWLPFRAISPGSMIREPNGLFRMWYHDFCLAPSAHDQATKKVWGEGTDYGYYPKGPGDFRDTELTFICYAESWDGIHWVKPVLGVIEFNGSTANNIVVSGARAAKQFNGTITNISANTVIRDDREPDPQKRYKLFGYWETAHKYDNGVSQLNRPKEDIKRFRKAAGQYVCYSPDGIHFGDLEPSGLAKTGTDTNNVSRDHKRNLWRAMVRPSISNEYSHFVRAAAMCTSPDLLNWSPLENVLVPDELDGFGAIIQFDTFVPFNYGQEDIGLVVNIDQRGGLRRNPFLACLGKNGQWKRIYRDQPFISHGAPGSFDRGHIVSFTHEPILVGDEMFFFYAAGSGIATHPSGGGCMGMARLRRDAFVGVMAGLIKPKSNFDLSGEGTFTTWPLKVSGPRLAVNFEKISDLAKFRVELLDENKIPIPGFTLDDCLPVTLDSIRSPVEWKSGNDLSSLLGKEVSIRASFVYGTVYAFKFHDAEKIKTP